MGEVEDRRFLLVYIAVIGVDIIFGILAVFFFFSLVGVRFVFNYGMRVKGIVLVFFILGMGLSYKFFFWVGFFLLYLFFDVGLYIGLFCFFVFNI